MLLVCCFCEQVRDESMGHGHWRELHVVYGVPHPEAGGHHSVVHLLPQLPTG